MRKTWIAVAVSACVLFGGTQILAYGMNSKMNEEIVEHQLEPNEHQEKKVTEMNQLKDEMELIQDQKVNELVTDQLAKHEGNEVQSINWLWKDEVSEYWNKAEDQNRMGTLKCGDNYYYYRVSLRNRVIEEFFKFRPEDQVDTTEHSELSYEEVFSLISKNERKYSEMADQYASNVLGINDIAIYASDIFPSGMGYFAMDCERKEFNSTFVVKQYDYNVGEEKKLLTIYIDPKTYETMGFVCAPV